MPTKARPFVIVVYEIFFYTKPKKKKETEKIQNRQEKLIKKSFKYVNLSRRRKISVELNKHISVD